MIPVKSLNNDMNRNIRRLKLKDFFFFHPYEKPILKYNYKFKKKSKFNPTMPLLSFQTEMEITYIKEQYILNKEKFRKNQKYIKTGIGRAFQPTRLN